LKFNEIQACRRVSKQLIYKIKCPPMMHALHRTMTRSNKHHHVRPVALARTNRAAVSYHRCTHPRVSAILKNLHPTPTYPYFYSRGSHKQQKSVRPDYLLIVPDSTKFGVPGNNSFPLRLFQPNSELKTSEGSSYCQVRTV